MKGYGPDERDRFYPQVIGVSACDTDLVVVGPSCYEYSLLGANRTSAVQYSCESYSWTLALLLFRGAHSSHGHWFSLRCSRLLLYFCCCTLRSSCADSLKGGITENCNSIGNPAEKWLRYFTLKPSLLGNSFECIAVVAEG